MATSDYTYEKKDILSEEELELLLEKPGGTCVSIYMPTPELGREKRKHPIKLKNLLRDVEQEFLKIKMRPASVKSFLKPLQKLIADSGFWLKQSAGLAILMNSRSIRAFSLPFECEEIVVVSDRYHLKPVLTLLSGNQEFCILALSQNQVKFFQCTPYGIQEIELKNVPSSLEEALKYDDPERQLQFHTQTSGVTGKDQRAAMFHGHGTGVDDSKDNILRFFREVEKGLQSLPMAKKKPLMLAGVEYLHAIYRSVNTNPRLLEAGIQGNIEKLSPEELLEKGWSVAQSNFKNKREEELARYNELKGSDLACADIKKIVLAAHEGRIDTLFVESGSEQWGYFDIEMRSVTLNPSRKLGAYDLTDYAAVQTYLKGGKVYLAEAREIPEISKCAALFRY
jgi:hypothetical protein